MNRLILVGNGFDLAHGLKTAYNDFIVWYVKQAFKAAARGSYDDALISIDKTSKFASMDMFDERIDHLVENSYKQRFSNITTLGEGTFGTVRYRPFNVAIRSSFLQTLFSKCSDSRWVDIESEFYEQLKDILTYKHINNKQHTLEAKEGRLTALNQALKCITTQLQAYLLSLPVPTYGEGYMSILTSPIEEEDVHLSDDDRRLNTFEFGTEPRDTYILNFNYTTTLEKYIKQFTYNPDKPKPMVNFIHGTLNDRNNPLVFGFGDEIDEDYLAMEKEKAQGYFEHIKSFWYFRTSNYHDLMRFVDGQPYQVYILGHSCGLSDRTMLHMLFEHENCKSIKIYYHGDKENNTFTSVTYEIARHFTNKAEMRNKIVSLDRSSNMPQYRS